MPEMEYSISQDNSFITVQRLWQKHLDVTISYLAKNGCLHLIFTPYRGPMLYDSCRGLLMDILGLFQRWGS